MRGLSTPTQNSSGLSGKAYRSPVCMQLEEEMNITGNVYIHINTRMSSMEKVLFYLHKMSPVLVGKQLQEAEKGLVINSR